MEQPDNEQNNPLFQRNTPEHFGTNAEELEQNRGYLEQKEHQWNSIFYSKTIYISLLLFGFPLFQLSRKIGARLTE
jgi:hypothetical protein